MKKFAALALSAVIACISLVGCSFSNKNTLTVGIAMSYPPFEYYEEDESTFTGIDIDLSTEIAKRLGMEVKYIATPFNEIFDGLNDKKYDIIVSACTITEARMQEYDFSIPYIQNYPCIVTLKASENKPTEPSKLEGMSICYQKGTTSEAFITDYISTNNLTCDTYGYQKVISCFEELSLARVNAIFVDSTVAEVYCNTEDSIFEITWQQLDNVEEFGIVIPKDNPELKEKINKVLEEMINDGSLQAIIDKYY
ncbi:MAG: ABC transporter substrate-binding protein [Lachnospiraceae bacterium]|nr:ABC transporter substrate-binding protein [Lachnospiraceae bacterium]